MITKGVAFLVVFTRAMECPAVVGDNVLSLVAVHAENLKLDHHFIFKNNLDTVLFNQFHSFIDSFQVYHA